MPDDNRNSPASPADRLYREGREAFCRVDRNLIILDVNPAFCRLLNYERADQAVGQPLAEILSISSAQLQDLVDELRRHGEAEWEIDLAGAGDAPRVVSLRALAEERDRGPIDLFLIAADTRPATTEPGEDWYKVLLDQSPAPIAVVDGWEIEYANHALTTLLGATDPGVLQGESVLNFVAYTDRAHLEAYFEVVSEGTLLPVCETALVRLDGKPIKVELSATPCRFDDRQCIQLLVRDITEHQEYERALRDEVDRAEKEAKAKGTFLAHVGHEVRTPLTGIIGFSSMMEEELEGSYKEMAGLIRASGQRLLATLNSIVDLARLESGSATVEWKIVDLSELVREACELFIAVAREKGLTFTIDYPEGPLIARVDIAFFHRILNNLLSNAIKFTEEGGIHVRTHSDEEQIFVSIRDTGRGISEEFQGQMFEEFLQERTAQEQWQGSGLGLAIVKELAQKINAEISVESIPAEGSTFTLSLPRYTF